VFQRRVAASLIVVVACGAASLGAEQGEAPRRLAPRDFYSEVEEDPPAAQAARDDLLARTRGAKIQVGNFVSIQVNVDEYGQNIVGDAANEPSIAVDPVNRRNIVIAWRQFDTVASNFRQAGWGYSHNGGDTWTFPGVLTDGIFRSDPVVDTDSNGTVYYQSLRSNFRVDVFRSYDAGETWAVPIPAWGGDKNWMTVDRSGGIGDGNIYGIWQRFFGCCGVRTLTRSTDGGGSYESPTGVPFRPTFGILDVGPDGELYAAGIDGTATQDFDHFAVGKSEDAADPDVVPTFAGTQVDLGGSMIIFGDPNPSGLLGQAYVGVDASNRATRGNVYMLASVDPPGADPADVHLVRSTDGGETWSDPVRVNDDLLDNGAWQWFGAMDVAPDGRIDVIWNDTRNGPEPNISELFYAYSHDEGRTWSKNIAVSVPFNTHLGWPNQNKLGDYYDLVSDETGVNVAFAATFNGEQDVYFIRLFPDCNDTGVSDVADIAAGTSRDGNVNSVPDECERGLGDPAPLAEGASAKPGNLATHRP
jgi:hypothetical protein